MFPIPNNCECIARIQKGRMFFILTHLHIIYLDHTLRIAATMPFKTHPGVRERVFQNCDKNVDGSNQV